MFARDRLYIAMSKTFADKFLHKVKENIQTLAVRHLLRRFGLRHISAEIGVTE